MNRIGRYEIQGDLGRGGMARVFRAWDPNFERTVAVKVLPRDLLDDPEFRVRFQQEARLIAALEHPAIVPVYDYGDADGQPYLVMRLMSGGSLQNRLRQGPLSLEETVRIIQQLAPAIDRAHTQGIVHRDFKPGNVLFDGDGNAYIADFGLARLVDADTRLSTTGMTGTPAYMAPEQAKGSKSVDGRADLYALGVMVYELLTGRLPFEADSAIALALKHVTEPPPRLRSVRPDLPEATEQALLRSMAKAATDRFPTAAIFESTLTQSLTPVLKTPAGERATLRTTETATVLHGVHGKPLWRQPWALGCAGLSVLALGAFVVAAAWQALTTASSPTQDPSQRASSANEVRPTPKASATTRSVPTRTASAALPVPPTRTPRPTREVTPTPADTDLAAYRFQSDPVFVQDSQPGSPWMFAVASRRTSGIDRYLIGMDPAAREVRWANLVANPPGQDGLIGASELNVAWYSQREVILFDAQTGEERWRQATSDVAKRPNDGVGLAVLDEVVVTLSNDGTLQGFSLADGSPLWSVVRNTRNAGIYVMGDWLVSLDENDDGQGVIRVVEVASGDTRLLDVVCALRYVSARPNSSSLILPTTDGQGFYVVLNGTDICISRIDWDGLEQLAEPMVIERNSQVFWPVIVADEQRLLLADPGGLASVDASAQDYRSVFEYDPDIAYAPLASFEQGAVVARVELAGTPSTQLVWVDPDTGEAGWTIDLGPGKPLSLTTTQQSDQSDLRFSARRFSDTALAMIGYRRLSDVGYTLVANTVDVTTGVLTETLVSEIPGALLAVQSDRQYMWRGTQVWFLAGGELWGFDFETSEVFTGGQ